MLVKIVRLKSGEDIIGSIIDKSDRMDIFEPMTVDVEQRGTYAGQLIMSNWLPINLIKENKTTLKMEDILLTLEPEEEFIEYYHSMVNKLHEVIKAKQDVKNLSDDQITEILNAMEKPGTRILH